MKGKNVEELLKDAQEFENQLDIENQLICLEIAAQKEPENYKVIDALAQFLINQGREEEAYNLLQRSIEMAPEQSLWKYCSFAQLHEGEEAV